MNDGDIIALAAIDARYVEATWSWPDANRAAITAHWEAFVARKPTLYNGRVLLARERSFAGSVYRANYFSVDYATFLAFRDFGFPDEAVSNGFAIAALRAADGAWLLGIMGEHTANAGRIYFPGGTPDPSDVTGDGCVDLAGSVLRELEEETGLGHRDIEATGTWWAVVDGGRTALIREVRSPLDAEALSERIAAFLARQEEPELAGMHIARSAADIDAARMPTFNQVFLRSVFGNR